MATLSYYYPEGPLGPVCDIVLDDTTVDPLKRLLDSGDGRISTYGPIDFKELEQVVPGQPAIVTRRCKVDDEGNYYDCQDVFLNPFPTSDGGFGLSDYDWKNRSQSPWGLEDDFEQAPLDPESCVPFDADINILPTKFFTPTGQQSLKYQVENSSPPTFAVTSEDQTFINNATITAEFSTDQQNLVIGGTGSGIVQLEFDWDDKPSISGQSVGTLTVAGASFSQGNREKGTKSKSVEVTAGQSYPITLSGNSGTSGSRLASSTVIEYDDDAPAPNIAGTYPITVAAQGTNGRGNNAGLKSVSSTRIKWTDSTSQNDTDAELIIRSTSGGATANFTGSNESNLALVITGSGTVRLEFEWDDNPNVNGQAVGQLTINGQTYNQTGDEGDETIRFGGGDFDINATLKITSILPLEPTTNVAGYWSDEGNEYAVWVNPAICTLPQLEQVVTYQVPIPANDTYHFTFGCDDTAQMFLGGSETPFMSIVGGIFEGGQYNTPYTSSTTLSQGTLQLVVRCTNSDAGFQDANGDPTGLAYSWARNPGGWYIKICRGGICVPPNDIQWVRSGPHPAWSTFMNDYAVFASNQETLSGVAQNATWNINLAEAGNYQLEVQADNQAAITFDGTSQGTVNSFTTSTTYTLNNLSVGPHTLAASVTNNVETVDNWSNNPAGVAWVLRKLAGTSSVTAKFAANGNLEVSGEGTGTIPLTLTWDETPQYGTANVSLAFDSNGNLVATGTGTATVELEFEWDDNPSTAGQALGNVTWTGLSGASFTQTSGVRRGSDDDTVTVTAGTTYNINVTGGSGYGGFTAESNRLCFKDLDGNDCNATIVIGNINQQQSEIGADQALTSITYNGVTLTQTSSTTGSVTANVAVTAGATYSPAIVGNPNGFARKNSGQRLCFFDSIGTDCNANLTIGNPSNNSLDVEVANSTQLNTPSEGNLIWHTRIGAGYRYTTEQP